MKKEDYKHTEIKFPCEWTWHPCHDNKSFFPMKQIIWLFWMFLIIYVCINNDNDIKRDSSPKYENIIWHKSTIKMVHVCFLLCSRKESNTGVEQFKGEWINYDKAFIFGLTISLTTFAWVCKQKISDVMSSYCPPVVFQWFPIKSKHVSSSQPIL